MSANRKRNFAFRIVRSRKAKHENRPALFLRLFRFDTLCHLVLLHLRRRRPKNVADEIGHGLTAKCSADARRLDNQLRPGPDRTQKAGLLLARKNT
jgi:hypothetical protein